jgi:hypothetical protein
VGFFGGESREQIDPLPSGVVSDVGPEAIVIIVDAFVAGARECSRNVGTPR